MPAQRNALVTLSRLCLATALLSVATLGGSSTAQAAVPAESQMRQPWTPPGTPAFERSWLILGSFTNTPKTTGEDTLATLKAGLDTDFLTNYADEGAARPTAGAQEPLPGGGTATWTAYTSPTDAVDLLKIYTDGQTLNRVVYAYTTVMSPTADDIFLTVGSDDSVRVWLNGKVIETNAAMRGVSADNDIIPVHLNAGANALLVKVVNAGGGWGFAARLAHPSDLGASLYRPWVAPETADHKILVSTAPGPNPAVPVALAVVAAGGKVVETRHSTLGEPVTFDASRWPEGAYEVWCTPTFPDGAHPTDYLLFYHGDVLGAARRLVATAPANAQTENELTHAMLADMIKYRVGDPATDQSLTADQIGRILSPLMEWEEIQSKSQIRPDGFVRFAYRDPVDDSPQFCLAYLPAGYTPSKKWPLVVGLHGANFSNPPYIGGPGTEWYVDGRHRSEVDRYPVIQIEPMGRYNSMYHGFAELDVLRAIREAKERFSVDDDRVYMGGISMGGAGTWGIASRHPELFAAVSPNLGIFDYHVSTPAADIGKMSPLDLYLHEAQSTLVGVDSLLTTPIFVNHGDQDPVISVDQSRYATRMLQRWGYDVRYWEHPGGGHGDFDTSPQVYPWFLSHTRVSNPTAVRVRAADIKTAAAHWVRVVAENDPFQMMTAEAEVTGPNRIKLATVNAAAVALSPKAPLVDPSKPLRIMWNGVEQAPAKLDGGVVHLNAAGFTPSAGDKNPLIAGPLNDITNTPYAIVVGTTSSDPNVRASCQKSADRMASAWEAAQHVRPRVLVDTKVTDADMAAYSLYLIGGADANAVTAKLASQLPLQVGPGRVTIAGRDFAITDAGYQAIFPNPRNPQRYVRVAGGTSAAGIDALSKISDDPYDFGIVDAASGKGVACGIFDAHWRCSDAGTIQGDEAASVMRVFQRMPR